MVVDMIGYSNFIYATLASLIILLTGMSLEALCIYLKDHNIVSSSKDYLASKVARVMVIIGWKLILLVLVIMTLNYVVDLFRYFYYG